MSLGREGKQAEPFSFALPPLNSHRVGGRGEKVFSGGVFGTCMPACREGWRTELCFRACAVKFPGPEGGVFYGSLPSAAALLVYACQRVGKANGVKVFCFRFRC